MNSPYLSQSQNKSGKKDFLGEYLGKIRSNWKLLVLVSVLSLAGAFIYIRYSVPLYTASATLLITKDSKKSELAVFEDLGFGASGNNITDEIAVLTSRILVRRVVDSLDLCNNYEIVGRVTGLSRVSLYGVSPLKLEFLQEGKETEELSLAIKATILNNNSLQIEYPGKDQTTKVAIGEWVTLKNIKYRLVKTEFFKPTHINTTVSISHVPAEIATSSYIGKLSVVNKDPESNLITISMNDVSAKRAENVINTLIRQYNDDVVADKNEVSANTANFINERMRLLSLELETIESSAQDYKTNNKLVDITSEAAMYLESESELNQQILETNTQVKLAGYVLDYMEKLDGTSELIPSNIGLTDQSIQHSVEAYNDLILDRNRALKTSSKKSPIVINLESQILELQKSLKESLRNYKHSLEVKLAEYKRSENKINSQISSVPKHEREYRSIMRQQQIKESLYLYLLQKREETAITLAITVDNAKVINPAYSSGSTISPKKNMIYFGALVGGIAFAIFLIYLRSLLDYKVHSKEDITSLGLDYLGDIPQSDEGKTLVAVKGSKSSISEAFRLLRTNLDFILASKSKSSAKRIFVSSTISQEGKSFISINLASTLSLSGKKVLLMGMDLRAPKFEQYLDIPHAFGISNYLANDELKIEDLIQRSHFSENVDILMSGDIPPNPSELLQGERVGEMFETLSKQYDYLIVDTAPLALVTDTLLLAHYAHTLIYVVRANRLDKRMLEIPKALREERRFAAMTVLLNGADHTGKGYGYGRYGYGYGYGVVKPRKWYERLMFWKKK